jgi:hypothetical protein
VEVFAATDFLKAYQFARSAGTMRKAVLRLGDS